MKILYSNLRLITILLMVVFSTCNIVFANDWLEDYQQAVKIASESDKMILMNFTGSDWCGWCIRLDKEVFSTATFKKYAEENLVLLKIDFPRRITQTNELRQQNADLQRTHNIRGYPTIVLLDKDEKVVAQTGYMKGGASNYVKNLERAIGKK